MEGQEATVGEELRRAREDLGRSLSDAEEATKIRRQYLDALEKGEYHRLPGGRVYVVGFLRSYARYLNLEPQPLVNRVAVRDDQAAMDDIPPVTLPRLRRPRKERRLFYVVVAFILLLLVGLSYAFNLYGDFLRTREPGQQLGDGLVEPLEEHPAAGNQPPESTGENPSNQQNPRAVSVIFQATGRSWIKVIVDGKVDFTGFLNAGDSKGFNGGEVSVILGDAGRVRVSLNGSAQGVMGRPGERVEKTFKAALP